MTRRIRILGVVNKQLPPHDYRIAYGRLSRIADVVLGMPRRREGVQSACHVPMHFGEGIGFRDVAEFLRLFYHLWSHRDAYDLVHFYSTKLQLFGPLCAWLAGTACVTTVTGFGRTFNRNQWKYRLLRPFYLALMRLSSRCAEAIFFQNTGDMHWLAEMLPRSSHKMFWVGSGVHCRVDLRKDFAVKTLRVLMVARLMPDKGVRTFLHAAARSSDRIQFTLVGPPSVGEEQLHQEVLRAQSRGEVSFLGTLDADALTEVYRGHHVFVLPSSGEGMSRAMLEAGHALMCPIASNISAHRDLIGPGLGYLLSSDSPIESLVSFLDKLNSDRALLEENARAFQEHVVRTYGVQAYTKRMDRHMKRVTAQIHAAGGDSNPSEARICGEPGGTLVQDRTFGVYYDHRTRC